MSFFGWFGSTPDIQTEAVKSESAVLGAQQRVKSAEQSLADRQEEIAQRIASFGGSERDITQDEREEIEDLAAAVELARKEYSVFKAGTRRLTTTKATVDMVEHTRRTTDVSARVAEERLGSKKDIEAMQRSAEALDQRTEDVNEALAGITDSARSSNRRVPARSILGSSASILARPAPAQTANQAQRTYAAPASSQRVPGTAARRPAEAYGSAS